MGMIDHNCMARNMAEAFHEDLQSTCKYNALYEAAVSYDCSPMLYVSPVVYCPRFILSLLVL